MLYCPVIKFKLKLVNWQFSKVKTITHGYYYALHPSITICNGISLYKSCIFLHKVIYDMLFVDKIFKK